MQPERTDPVFLCDMLDAAQGIVEFTKGKTFQRYLDDRLLRAGVERCIEIIGEAARHVSREFQSQHPGIPWRKIIVQRHVLAHEYGEIKHELIWRVATIHIPTLIAQLSPLIPERPADSGNSGP